MNFEWNHGLILVSLEIIYEGLRVKVEKCILDTGSGTSAIDIDLIPFNYQKHSTVRRLFGIGGGSQEVVAQTIDKVILDGKELSNIKIEFGDIKEELGINGFIGNDILKRFTVIIDYAKQKIKLV